MTADFRPAGFTLIELLVALAIFAVLATLAFGGLGEAATQSQRLDASQQRWADLRRAVRVLENDLAQLRARPVRDILGQSYEPALNASGSGGLRFTRGGWLNPALQARAELQRVRYRLLDGSLVREYWPVLDRTGATEPHGEILLAQVREFRVEFLPQESSGPSSWTAFWPPLGDTSIDSLPAGVRITLTVPHAGRIMRLIEVGG